MKIKWYGHSAFRITTSDGTGIIIDPYESGGFGGAITYGPITDRANIVLVSHGHADHNYTASIEGPYSEVHDEGVYEIRGVKIRAVPAFHDESKGKQRGKTLLLVIEADGLSVVHLGDLGHPLSDDLVKRIGRTGRAHDACGRLFHDRRGRGDEGHGGVEAGNHHPHALQDGQGRFPDHRRRSVRQRQEGREEG